VNVADQPKLNYRSPSVAYAPIIGTFLVFAFSIGCFSRGPTAALSGPVISFTALKNSVVQLRELSLNRDIKLELAKPVPSVGAQDQTATGIYSPASLAQVAWIYKRIGLLPETSDFAKALAKYQRLDRMTWYDPTSATVVINPEAVRLGRAVSETDPRISGETPAVFGIAEALQEQHFQWKERMNSVTLEDRQLAFRAVARGDATLVVLSRADDGKRPAAAATAERLNRLASAVEELASDLPEFLRRKLVFPYREGSQFVLWALASRGWQGVNALYADPPLSTSQILHPEKYYVAPENPLRIFPWGLARQMKDSALLEQTLGEYLIGLLLSHAGSSGEATERAAAWQGDLLSAYQEADGLATAWISAWKSDQDALGFFHSYAAVLEKLNRNRFTASLGKTSSWQAELSDGRSMVLQVKGPMVLLLDGMPLARTLEVAEKTWKDLETDRESIAIPFELAKRARQLASRRR
jgi:hypothetical protein